MNLNLIKGRKEMTKLYSRLSDHETVLELWEASTKHPDSIFYFSKFNKNPFLDEKSQIFPWLLECASRLNWPFHTYCLASFAMELYDTSWGTGF